MSSERLDRDPQATLADLSEAAERAWASYEYELAIDLYSWALERSGTSVGERFDLLRGRERCYRRLGRLEDEMRDLQAMIELAKVLDDAERHVDALALMSALLSTLGRLGESKATAQVALDVALGSGDSVSIAKGLRARAAASMRLGETVAAGEDAERALDRFRTAGDRLNEANCLRLISSLNTVGSSRAADYAQRSLALYREVGDKEGEASALNGISLMHPDLAVQRDHLVESNAIFETLGDVGGMCLIHNNLGLLYWRIGLNGTARELADSSLEIARRLGLTQQLTATLETWGRILLDQGDLAAAHKAFEEGLPLVQEMAWGYGESFMLSALGRVERANGNYGEALALFEQAGAIVEPLEEPTALAETLALQGSCLLALGRGAEALACTRRAVDLSAQDTTAPTGDVSFQELWWHHVEALEARVGSEDDVWFSLRQARRVMLDEIGSLSDDGLRRNFFNKVAVNRSIIIAWTRRALERGLELETPEPASGNLQAQLGRLLAIGVRMNLRRDPAGLFSFVIDELIELTGAERALLSVVDAEGGREVAASYGFVEGEALSVDDVASVASEAERIQGPVLRQLDRGSPLEALSVMAVPLVSQGRTIGLIRVENRALFGPFAQSDLDLLTAFANQVGSALENARLYQGLEQKVVERTGELEQRAAELQIINSVQGGLASKLDIQGIYDLVGDRIQEIFDAQAVGIGIYDPETDMLAYPYLVEMQERHHPEPKELADTGFAGVLLRSREPLMINRDLTARSEEMGSTVVAGAPPKALLAVPLLVGGEARGVIMLQNISHEDAYSDADLRLLTTLANSMSVALENARLFDETRRLLSETEQRASELATVNSVGEALVSEIELDSLIELVGEQTRTTFDADIAYLALLDREAGIITFPYSYGDDLSTIRYGEGLTSRILDSGESLLINEDLEFKRVELDSERVGMRALSYLGVPIVVGRQTIGVLSVQSTSREGRFAEADVRLLSTIAANVGAAIHNAQLYRESTRRAEETAALAEIANDIAATQELEPVLEISRPTSATADISSARRWVSRYRRALSSAMAA
jgi:GAF domain-containing protein